MNNVIISGRLTRSPELKYSTNNIAVTRFTVAVDKNMTKAQKAEAERNNQPTADFINCVALGILGENITKFTDKGLRVLVHGRIQTGSYEKNGQRIYTTDVLVGNVEFIDWKGQEHNNHQSNSSDYNNDYSNDFEERPKHDGRIPF